MECEQRVHSHGHGSIESVRSIKSIESIRSIESIEDGQRLQISLWNVNKEYASMTQEDFRKYQCMCPWDPWLPCARNRFLLATVCFLLLCVRGATRVCCECFHVTPYENPQAGICKHDPRKHPQCRSQTRPRLTSSALFSSILFVFFSCVCLAPSLYI